MFVSEHTFCQRQLVLIILFAGHGVQFFRRIINTLRNILSKAKFQYIYKSFFVKQYVIDKYKMSIINRLVLCLALSALVLFSSVQCQSDEQIDEDLDDFIYHDVPTLSEKNREDGQSTGEQFLSQVIQAFSKQQVQKAVNERIGVDNDGIDDEGHVIQPANLSNLQRILINNKKWTKNKIKGDPEYFKRHQYYQKPTYLWIGCSDSRLPANEILGLDYGEVFVLRNVANMVSPSDISSLAVIQYAVQDIIVAGHYGCGGVKAAVTKYDHGPLEAWLSKLRRIRHKHSHAFSHLNTVEEKAKLLVEINVKQQVFNVASTTFVQKAWKDGKELRIHGLVYDMQTGRLVDLHLTMHSIQQLPEELAIFE